MAKANPPRPGTPGRVRCAIYTRKSTEEGLDQAFNSLDAQREACAAYIVSQRHEGWVAVSGTYDDGGFSGGTMERPGLGQLMADIAAGKVDVIVVYKVDRLTRSLTDFAKIVDVLDGAGASFVSITQAFNTTTSMGRLTLNVLLSFAQFERQVTGERIRDKVAASKRKGMWMGGNVPLGYDVADRKLVVNDAKAATVRHIYERYLELRSIATLAAELEVAGIRSKPRIGSDGVEGGRRVLRRGAIAHILKNRLYVGEVTHQGEMFVGEHSAIIARPLWDQVQALSAANRTNQHATASGTRSLLIGRIRDAEGRAMSPVHANKEGRRYRYYVTRADATGRPAEAGWRLPAGELEQLVLDAIARFLRDRNMIAGCASGARPTMPLAAMMEHAAALAIKLDDPATRRAPLVALDATVQVQEQAIAVEIAPELCTNEAAATQGDPPRHTILVPAKLTRRGQELRLAYPPADHRAPAEPDVKLIGLIAKAEAAHRELLDGPDLSKNRRAHLTQPARLRYLAPDITTAILDGRQPVALSARKLLRAEALPLCWHAQRRELGFG